jgi:hypothetical protein
MLNNTSIAQTHKLVDCKYALIFLSKGHYGIANIFLGPHEQVESQ